MPSSIDSGFLADVNVWIALALDKHEHHTIAQRWFDRTATSVYFCRVTQMALLRLLTNRSVMSDEVQTPVAALSAYKELMRDERVRFALEPFGVEAVWMSLMGSQSATGSAWTDAYLAAFSVQAGFRMITFDRGMSRWRNISVQVLPSNAI